MLPLLDPRSQGEGEGLVDGCLPGRHEKRMGCHRPTCHIPFQADLSAFVSWLAILPALASHWTRFTTLITATCREGGRDGSVGPKVALLCSQPSSEWVVW